MDHDQDELGLVVQDLAQYQLHLYALVQLDEVPCLQHLLHVL
jgi:hypothetical protein